MRRSKYGRVPMLMCWRNLYTQGDRGMLRTRLCPRRCHCAESNLPHGRFFPRIEPHGHRMKQWCTSLRSSSPLCFLSLLRESLPHTKSLSHYHRTKRSRSCSKQQFFMSFLFKMLHCSRWRWFMIRGILKWKYITMISSPSV